MNDTTTYQQTIEILAQWKFQMRTVDGRSQELDQRTLAVISFIYNVGDREIVRAINDKVAALAKRG